jgi:hypothetical protein
VPDRATATTRRTALGVALGTLVAATACDLDDLDPRSEPATPAGSPTEPPADADAELVEQVVADLVVMLGAPAVATRAMDVRRATTAFTELHLAHAEALESPQADAPTHPAPRIVSRAEALRTLRRRERAHQRRLEEACLAATSGSLARLFASMSAAVAQRLAVLPEEGA